MASCQNRTVTIGDRANVHGLVQLAADVVAEVRHLLAQLPAACTRRPDVAAPEEEYARWTKYADDLRADFP